MDAHPNPRNRADPDLILSTPLPKPFAAAASSAAASSTARSLTTDAASPFEPLCSASGPRNPAVHSKKKTVLLCDWWLLSAPEAHEGRRLSVSGVVAEQQKAKRVIKSAPITKRYDSFSLGTADGITLRIQGVINKARSHQNGIPLEICSLFLNGFPSNWDNYAGACFEGKFNSASVPESAASANELSEGFADVEGCLFPVHSDDFSVPVPISVNYGHENEFLKSCNANSTQSDTIIGINSREEKILDLSISKIQNNQSKRGRKKQQSPLSVCRAYKKNRSLHSSGRAFWRPSYDYRYPLTRDTAKKLSIASPESLNLKRSRSGRLLVPPIAKWCQKIIYAAGDMHQLVFQAQPNITHCLRIGLCLCCLTYIFSLSPCGSPNLNGEIMGITGEGLENITCIESQSEPPRKTKKLV